MCDYDLIWHAIVAAVVDVLCGYDPHTGRDRVDPIDALAGCRIRVESYYREGDTCYVPPYRIDLMDHVLSTYPTVMMTPHRVLRLAPITVCTLTASSSPEHGPLSRGMCALMLRRRVIDRAAWTMFRAWTRRRWHPAPACCAP